MESTTLLQPITYTSTTLNDDWAEGLGSSIINRSRAGQRNKRVGMRSLRGSVGGQVGRDLLQAGGGVEAVDGAVEQGKRGNGLVVWDLVAGLIDAREGKVAVFARLAVLDAVDDHGHVARCAELLRVGVFGLETYGFAAEPVALGMC